MIAKPTTKELLRRVSNEFELVTIISKRARQLVNGEKPLVETNEMSPVTIASLEFDEEKYDVKKDTKKK